MNPASFRRTLLRTCWLPLLGALAAVSFQAVRIASRPPEYAATGRIIAGVQIDLDANDMFTYALPPTFYGTQIELLESSLLRSKAAERVRGLHPELKQVEVGIQVTQTAGSAIMSVIAVGPDRKYTRYYLDALLDEFMALRKRMFDNTVYGTVNRVFEDVLAREKPVFKARTRLEDFSKSNDSAELCSTERLRLVQLVSQLRGELEALGAAAAAAATVDAVTANLPSLEVRLRGAEEALRQVESTSDELASVKGEYDRALQDLEDWKKKLERLNTAGTATGEPLAILERPLDAFEMPVQVWTPILAAGLTGFLGGFALALALSLAAALVPPSRGNPPPLA